MQTLGRPRQPGSSIHGEKGGGLSQHLGSEIQNLNTYHCPVSRVVSPRHWGRGGWEEEMSSSPSIGQSWPQGHRMLDSVTSNFPGPGAGVSEEEGPNWSMSSQGGLFTLSLGHQRGAHLLSQEVLKCPQRAPAACGQSCAMSTSPSVFLFLLKMFLFFPSACLFHILS